MESIDSFKPADHVLCEPEVLAAESRLQTPAIIEQRFCSEELSRIASQAEDVLYLVNMLRTNKLRLVDIGTGDRAGFKELVSRIDPKLFKRCEIFITDADEFILKRFRTKAKKSGLQYSDTPTLYTLFDSTSCNPEQEAVMETLKHMMGKNDYLWITRSAMQTFHKSCLDLSRDFDMIKVEKSGSIASFLLRKL